MDLGRGRLLSKNNEDSDVVADRLMQEAANTRELETSYLGNDKQTENTTIYGIITEIEGKKAGRQKKGGIESQSMKPKQIMKCDEKN